MEQCSLPSDPRSWTRPETRWRYPRCSWAGRPGCQDLNQSTSRGGGWWHFPRLHKGKASGPATASCPPTMLRRRRRSWAGAGEAHSSVPPAPARRRPSTLTRISMTPRNRPTSRPLTLISQICQGLTLTHSISISISLSFEASDNSASCPTQALNVSPVDSQLHQPALGYRLAVIPLRFAAGGLGAGHIGDYSHGPRLQLYGEADSGRRPSTLFNFPDSCDWTIRGS